MVVTGSKVFGRVLSGVCVAAFLGGTVSVVVADDGPAKPRIDCTKPENKKKAACKPHRAADDAIINGAYWLAHVGKLTDSLALLATVSDHENPRYLNAMGFATRKLGNVDAALPYYTRALEIEPDYVQAREYMGEAFLAKGDLARAGVQLQEIERRCGSGCVSFVALKQQIAAFEAAHPVRG
ncbi:tetratricopeptide repeat protein [Hyphomicrobium sp. LHD-15]|uniref:tetratricopeptide repeat protein n=1 Tax=Hyphomicrobium sp. LHD-15 TaxID=3072142 RepID=UPI00280FBBF0|nr:tetratricopeptide repeat protein [Hyphomicrobium sp. LHD-15]MDQ8699050.1 tetratricopeptide repeat protein [Hyphomicrobium sp. LHD-15]